MNQKKDLLVSNIYFFGLLLMIVGLPLSKVLMSLSQMALGLVWFIEVNYKERILGFLKKKIGLAVISIFLLHIVGMIYTHNFNYGINDIRIKLPLFILPFIMATSKPLSNIRFSVLLGTFCLTTLVTSIISIFVLNGWFHQPVTDIRNISIFISHIRFGLLICIAIFCAFYLFYKHQFNIYIKATLIALIVWYFIFLVISESMTGLSILIVIGIVLLIYYVFKHPNIKVKIALLAVVIIVPTICFGLINTAIKKVFIKHQTDKQHLDKFTSQHNLYFNNLNNTETENGYPVWVYVCDTELKTYWEKRSKLAFDGTDKKKQLLRYTLIRFLSSKGLRKDADGVIKLSNTEITSIENGIANVDYQSMTNINNRIDIIVWEINNYFKGNDPSAHSVSQRFEYWKTAINIIKKHPIIGVGTGDINDAFQQQYKDENSTLSPEWRLRSHNQYLSIGVAFGILGLLVFAFSLFYPLFANKMHFDFLYVTFFLVAIISMLTEDTLETQAGATFFAFFNSIFLFLRPTAKKSNEDFRN
jgi:hypothetical protein